MQIEKRFAFPAPFDFRACAQKQGTPRASALPPGLGHSPYLNLGHSPYISLRFGHLPKFRQRQSLDAYLDRQGIDGVLTVSMR